MRNKLLAGLLIALFVFSMMPLLPSNFQKNIQVAIPSFASNSTGIIQTWRTISGSPSTTPVGNNHVVIVTLGGFSCSLTVPSVTSITDNLSDTYHRIAFENAVMINAFTGCPSSSEGLISEVWYTVTNGSTRLSISPTISSCCGGGFLQVSALETNQSLLTLKGQAAGSFNKASGQTGGTLQTNSSLTPASASDLLISTAGWGGNSGVTSYETHYNQIGGQCAINCGAIYRNDGTTSSSRGGYNIGTSDHTYIFVEILVDLDLVGFVTTTSTVSITATITSTSIAATQTLTAYNTPNGVNWILLLFGLMFLPMTLWGVYAKFRGRGSSITFLTIFSLMLGALILTISEFNTPSPFVPLGIAVFYIAAFLVYIINSRRKGMPPTI